MTAVRVNVLRSVIRVVDGETVVSEETLTAVIDEDTPDGSEVVIYTLDEVRLRGALEAAAAGEPVDDILLALDAAALDEGEEEG